MIFDTHEAIPIGENAIVDFSDSDNAEHHIKPIQPTPELYCEDAKNVIYDILRTPSPSVILRQKSLLELRKRIEKREYDLEKIWEEILDTPRSVDGCTMQKMKNMCNKKN